MKKTVLARGGAGIVAAATLIGLVAGCSSESSDSSGSSSSRSGGAVPAGLRTVTVTITSGGCSAAHTSYDAGPLTFEITNKDATAVSELEVLSEDRILGERENMPPGFSGSFSVNLGPGAYTLYCPGATTEKSPLKITGKAAEAPNTDIHALLVSGAKGYKDFVVSQVSQLIDGVKNLDTAIKSGNLKDAQVAYINARPFYERIEPVAESFPAHDPAIDARIADVPNAKDWTGFHPIERALFQAQTIKGLTALSAGLITNAEKLQTLVNGLSGFQPTELANGAVELLNEAAKSKITGEEEAYSHIDLVDFAANVQGAQQAFAYLQDGLVKIDPALTATIKSAFANVTTVLNDYKDSSNPSGYKLYPQLTKADTRDIAQALQAVAEPLSRVSGKIVDA